MTSEKQSTFFSIDLTIGNWRWWFGIVVLLVSILSMVFLNAVHHISLGIILFTTIVLSLAIKPRVISNQDYGLVLGNIPKLILWTLIAFVIFACLVYWFEHSSSHAMEASKEVMQSLKFGESYQGDLLLILTICVFAPLNEELIYRAVIFRGIWNGLLKQKRFGFSSQHVKCVISFTVATIVSSYLFMSSHGGEGQDIQIYMILLLGIIACGLYALTGSLIAPIMFHSLNNTFALWQSLDNKHMFFTEQIETIPLNIVLYASPLLVLILSLLLSGLIKLLSRLRN